MFKDRVYAISHFPIKQHVRRYAEQYHVIKRDALNLVNLHIRSWLEHGENIANFPPIHLPVFWTNAFRMVTNARTAHQRSSVNTV
jgi:hypothetical protein